MNDELSPSDVAEPEQDIDQTPTQEEPPTPVSSDVWTMPEPVFKKTSGYLPQGFNRTFDPAPQGNEDTTVEQPKPEVSQPQAAVAEQNVPDVEPQPDVIEDGILDSSISAQPLATPKKKGVFGRILMILLALIIVVLMAAVVVGVIWFVYWPLPDVTID